jgi:sulfatase modifying factor 1
VALSQRIGQVGVNKSVIIVENSTKFSIFVLIILFSSCAFAKPKSCGCETAPKRFIGLAAQPSHEGMVNIPAGTLWMGGDNAQARQDELPKHAVTLSAFWLDITEVTNAQYAKFIEATHYVTTAEKKPDWDELKKQLPPNTPKPPIEKLVPASLVFTPPDHPVALDNAAQWWSWTPGADWRHPSGPDSSIEKLAQHPVVQVSWDDAAAYCKWAGKHLPTEAQWEWAARGGLKNKIYPWGDEPIDAGTVKANTWQGNFPNQNTLRDHYATTAPAQSFAPNGYGLYDMAGNVWEWVADWYSADYYTKASKQKLVDPTGSDTSYDPYDPIMPKKILRGGSFLCNESYCSGYRVAARMKTSADTSMQHIGFRCASG